MNDKPYPSILSGIGTDDTDAHLRQYEQLGSWPAARFLNSASFWTVCVSLANDLHLPLVRVGTNEAKQALMTDQQLADRFEARELPAWRDDACFHQLLASLVLWFDFATSTTFCSTRSANAQARSSEGVTVRVCRLLEEAAVQAITSGGERIELETLSEELVTGRSPLSLSVKMRLHPVFLSASSCISRFWLWVDTRRIRSAGGDCLRFRGLDAAYTSGCMASRWKSMLHAPG
jgi:hypothetical protein